MKNNVPLYIAHGGCRRLDVRMSGPSTDAPVSFGLYEILPGDECGKHVHTGRIETWVVVSGRGVAEVGDQIIPVAAGVALVTTPGTPHAMRNTGRRPLRFLNLVTITGDGPDTTTDMAT